jgi:formamidopyrimidine-DNA glycosylase
MDQKNIAGIGNLYADEILFFAGVMPTRKISTLTGKEIEKILAGIKKILKEAIKYRGSSVDNYLDARGKTGEYHLRLKVYGRKGQPCKKCKTKIQKIKLAGRGTHFCPKCQK